MEQRNPTPRYLHHVTLTTGRTRQSWRHEIDPALMGQLVGIVQAARAESGMVLPGFSPECRLYITDTRRCALCTVKLDDGAPVVTFAVADHARCGSQLWRLLIETAQVPCALGVDQRPAAPWCAARLESGIALLPQESVEALGDLERCIAWAWFEAQGLAH